MDALFSILLLVGLFLLAPIVLGGAAAGVVRSTRRNLPPDQLRRKAMTAFWITAIVVLALELTLFGLCLSTLNQMG
jgi:hypothetical protein